MSSQLDPSILAAITAEARQCFLDEDAPEYLAMLEEGIKQGSNSDFTLLLRAAHSIKGGAGLASLTSLQELAHKLEDVLIAIGQGQITEVDFAWNLVERAVDEVAFILSQARTTDNAAADPELLEALAVMAALVQTEELEATDSQNSDSNELEGTIDSQNNLVANTLNHDLEETLSAIADLTADAPAPLIEQLVTSFADECLFMGETLDLPWLVEAIAPIEDILATSTPEAALSRVQAIVADIRQQRDLYLQGEQNLSISPDTEEAVDVDDIESTILLDSETSTKTATVAPAPPAPKAALSQLRIPVEKLEGMTNNVEELILTQARLNRQQQLLNQANRRLRGLSRQFEPIKDKIQILYDELAVGSTELSQQVFFANSTKDNTTKDSEVALKDSDGDDLSFDSLELDRYTELHSSLQSLQELMLQVQETRSDIDLVNRELAENLEQTQKNLDALYSNVNDSRLVPFHILAKRFIPQIRNLNQRFDKSVNLEIQGETTPIDQILLEQLQTPLTHLLNNAFDHGIESNAERLAKQKSTTASIMLKAALENNQLLITIQDDGSGINLEKVYQRAVERGICPPYKSIDQLQPEEIIDWIFEPDFSTASQVSDISGRGMGLDIVRSQIRQLKGNIQVQTKANRGTTFTIKLPFNLSLQSLLLVQLQQRIIAIPNSSVIQALPYQEIEFTDNKQVAVKWQKQTIPVHSIASLLPCPRQPLDLDWAKVGIVLETAFGLSMVLVDALLKEEKLIVKPFDDTVPLPPYIAGCTVLGTGEVLPVILPQGLEPASVSASPTSTRKTVTNLVPTILIAEDSVATRRMLEKVLSTVGYQVIVCRDGQEALDSISQHQGTIDLIVSDIEMPRVNGFELLQQVRTMAAYENTPVVMATSRTGDRHRQQAMKLGATDYLGKPVQPQELINKVAALLTKS